jgi:hypothetical protein
MPGNGPDRAGYTYPLRVAIGGRGGPFDGAELGQPNERPVVDDVSRHGRRDSLAVAVNKGVTRRPNARARLRQ